ncbi:alpha/beta hydrolase family protein [Ottowia oryzae]
MNQFVLPTSGGARVAVREFAPATAARGSVVLGGAMGVPQSYYAPFAQWLAAQGWRVTTFDYRGHGDSLALGPPLRTLKADLNDWARDYEAVVAYARAAAIDGPLYLIGHSLGAQLPGMFAQPERVDGLLAVATGVGYWRHNAAVTRRRAPLLWWFLVPVVTPLAGYFPGRLLGVVGDLPAGVIQQWRRWCLHPEYSVGVEGPAVRASYASVAFPIRAFAVADDEMLTAESMQGLLRLYTSAPHQVQRIEPQAVGLKRIGHLGWFRASSQAALWPLLAQALNDLPHPAPRAHS